MKKDQFTVIIRLLKKFSITQSLRNMQSSVPFDAHNEQAESKLYVSHSGPSIEI